MVIVQGGSLLAVAVTALASACARVESPAVAAEVPVPMAVAPVAPPPAPVRKTIADHVIILSEDGLRPDAIKRARAPVHQALMRQGAWSLRAKTIRSASTLPSHAAMLSGFDVHDHGLWWNSWHPERGFIKVPTVFTVATDAGKTTAAFVGKRKLEHIAHGPVNTFSRPGYYCRKVVDQAAAHFVEKLPQIEFVHFSDPDDLGHSDGWMSDQQLTAVSHADRCLGTLIDAIKRSKVADRTLLIISADHGGSGRTHDGSCQEDRLIPWIAWGAGVRPGRLRNPISTVDTAATALWALGYPPTAGGAGRPVHEAFAD